MSRRVRAVSMARSEYRRGPPRRAAPAGCPGGDRLRGHPHRHIATANEGPVVGRPVRHAIFRLIRGMDLRLHPCSVAPAEGHEKCRPNRPTPAGSSCNNATLRYRVHTLGIENDLAPDRPGIVVPELAHNVQPIGAVRFSVEFLRASDGGP